MVLGEGNVNIAEYLLSRTDNSGSAYSIIKVDGQINKKMLEKLSQIDEILDIKQLYV